MNGLELSRGLYLEYGKHLLQVGLSDSYPKMAIGLVGEGSECFGFDDELSRDHDWGPAFCLWLPKDILSSNRERIEKVLASLPETYSGFQVRMQPVLRVGRVGPLALEDFYRRFLGQPSAPSCLAEWRRIPEQYLSVATNGEIFEDNLGLFSAIRKKLLDFYPEDIRLKKIASRCMSSAQSGQYNLPRMLKRYDYTAASICLGRFSESIISLVFLLHKRYVPFYKWASKGVKKLSALGTFVGTSLERLSCLSLMGGRLMIFCL